MTLFEKWLAGVNEERKAYFEKQYPNTMELSGYVPLTYKKNTKFVKIIDNDNGSVWGFVAMQGMAFKGTMLKMGDLLKPASWSSPAKHARGNIFDGTAMYTVWGPAYLK